MVRRSFEAGRERRGDCGGVERTKADDARGRTGRDSSSSAARFGSDLNRNGPDAGGGATDGGCAAGGFAEDADASEVGGEGCGAGSSAVLDGRGKKGGTGKVGGRVDGAKRVPCVTLRW